jgi:hypothetical protein
MARSLLRLFSQRLASSACKPNSRLPSSHHHLFSPSSRSRLHRRTYATGPNPRPGQSPFKVWPFIAITLAGTGAYVLMVRNRAGMSILFSMLCNRRSKSVIISRAALSIKRRELLQPSFSVTAPPASHNLTSQSPYPRSSNH